MQPDNCGPTYIVVGDGGNEEGIEQDFTSPQAEWSAYRDVAFGQASFVIVNETVAEWTWKADDGTPIDAVRTKSLFVLYAHLQQALLDAFAISLKPSHCVFSVHALVPSV